MITIYADGACRGNQNKTNRGSYAFVALDHAGLKIQSVKGERNTTNNIMELKALIDALSWYREVHNEPFTDNIRVVLDSQYVLKGITEWIYGWMQRGWISSTKKPVANQELWKELYALQDGLPIKYEWTKGHASDKWNNTVDDLCNAYLDGEFN